MATALGFAYTSTDPLETHVSTLASLAVAVPGVLDEARIVALDVEVASARVRASAAELLDRAASMSSTRRLGDHPRSRARRCSADVPVM